MFAIPTFDADLFAFTVPFNTYLQMLENSKDSFLQAKTWTGVKNRLK